MSLQGAIVPFWIFFSIKIDYEEFFSEKEQKDLYIQ
jgi:hypothetical protein